MIPILKSIKGLFCLTYANTSIKKELFKGFKVFTVNTKYVGEKSKGGQSKKVKEYIITNYSPVKKISGGYLEKAFDKNKDEYNKIIENLNNNNDSTEAKKKSVMRKIKDKVDKNKDYRLWIDLQHATDSVRPINTLLTYDNLQDVSTLTGGNTERVIGGNMERVIGGCGTCGMGGSKPSDKCSGCMGKCGKGMVKFHKQLEKVGLNHDKYMKQVKRLAKDTGYDPSKVHMSEDEDHKCVYHSPDGDVYFGKVGYGDFIIYSWLEQQGEEEDGFAEMKRNAYLSRATKIKGDWKDNKYSPNNLAINLLWAGNI